VLERLNEAHLKLSPKKCHFFKTNVKVLGHIKSDEGVSTDPSKIKAVHRHSLKLPKSSPWEGKSSFMSIFLSHRNLIIS
jgi:hypothetical protein